MPATKTPNMHHSRRWNVTSSMVGFKNSHIYAKISPKMVNPRDIAGVGRRRRSVHFYASLCDLYLDSRSQGCNKAETSLPLISKLSMDLDGICYAIETSLFNRAHAEITLFDQYLRKRTLLDDFIQLQQQRFYVDLHSDICRRISFRVSWFFFFCVSSYISGVRLFLFLVRFLCMWTFVNPTIEVATFRLHGWCILGVFLLPVFIFQEQECQDLLSPCNGMHVCIGYTSVYTRIQKSFWGRELEPMLTPKEKIPSTEGSGKGRTCNIALCKTASPTHYQLSYSRPHI